MKKSFTQIESKGLPGGPNEQFTYVTGVFSIEGYKSNSPDVNNPYNVIDSGDITMEGVDFPVMGTDNLGNEQMMMPGANYQFPGDQVFEVPMAKRGGGLLNKTMKCNSCGWSWKAADGGADVSTCHKCGGSALPKAQSGKEVPKRNGVRLNYDNEGKVIGESTHIMKAEIVDGKWYGFPTLFQNEDGTWNDTYEKQINLNKKDWMPAFEEAKRRGEVIDFGTDKETAIKFGEGSWKPQKQYGGSLPQAQDGIKRNTPEYDRAYEKGNITRYNPETDVYQAADLQEFIVKAEDTRVTDAIKAGRLAFGKGALEALSAPQKQMVEWATGKQQLPSEAWGFNNPKKWSEPGWGQIAEDVSDFALDATTDPLNLIGAGAANKALKVGNYGKKGLKGLKGSPNNMTTTFAKLADGSPNVVSSVDDVGSIDYRIKGPLSDKKKEIHEWMYQQMRFAKLPQTTNKQSIDVLDKFKQRIKTSEGQKRLKELGITEDQLLQDLRVVEDPNTHGYYRGLKNTISMNPNSPLSNNVLRHEIEHGVQNALRESKINKAINGTPAEKLKTLESFTTEIDDILSDLTLRKEGSINKVWDKSSSNRRVDPNQVKVLLSNKQNATDYFLTGSNGREKSAFLGEVQQYMMDIGKIPKNSYVQITPKMVKETMMDAMFDEKGGGKYLRLFNIMKPGDANYSLVAKGLNKMLGMVPAIGAGALSQYGPAQEDGEFQQGGESDQKTGFDLSGYFSGEQGLIPDYNGTPTRQMFDEQPVKQEVVEEVVKETIKEKPKGLNIEGLKKGISQAESLGGTLMMNSQSTATGLYGQRFSELEGTDIYSGSRDDFAKDLEAQNRVFELRLNKGINGKGGLIQDAEDLYTEYSPQIKNFKYSKEDLIALTNFLGRQGTRNYLGYHIRDGKPLSEALPNIYGKSAKQANKKPSEYLKVIREYYKTGGETDMLSMYSNYIDGAYEGTKMEKKASKVYDKLNRMHYRDAKAIGMTPANYVMTNIIGQS